MVTLTDAVNFHSLARLPGYRGPAPTGSSSHTDGSLMVCLHLICIQRSPCLVAVITDECVRASSASDNCRGAAPHLKRTRHTVHRFTKSFLRIFVWLLLLTYMDYKKSTEKDWCYWSLALFVRLCISEPGCALTRSIWMCIVKRFRRKILIF